jgi:WD40 repeat protein
MVDVVNALIPAYEEAAGRAYPRSRIKRAAHGDPEVAVYAGGGDISNRALSFLDLGKTADALRVLRSWLAEHPADPVAWCNESLIRVCNNETSLIEAVRQYVDFISPSRPRWHDLGIEPSRYLSFVAQHYIADHSTAIVGLHWLPALGALLSVSRDGLLLCRKLESNEWQIRWKARTGRDDATGSWLINEKYLAIGHSDGTLELRALADGALLRSAKLEPTYKPPYAVLSGTSLPISNAVRGVVHDPATDRLSVYLQNADLLEVSFPSLEVLSDRHEHRDFTFCVTAPSDASFILLGELQGVLRFYRWGGDSPERIIENRHQVSTTDSRRGEKGTKLDRADLRCLSSSPDGTWVASGSREGGILLWRTADVFSATTDPHFSALKEWIFPGPIEALAFGHNSDHLFFSDRNHVLRSIDLTCLGEPSVIARCNSAVHIIAPSPDHVFLGIGCSDGTVFFQPLSGVTSADLPFLITRPRSPDEHLRKQEELAQIAMKARAASAVGHHHECLRLAEQGLALSADQEDVRKSLNALLLRLPTRRLQIRSISHKWSFSGFKRGLVSAEGHRPYVNALAVATLRGFVVVATDEGLHRLRLEDGGGVDSINIPQTRVMDYEEKGDSCAVCTVVGAMGILYFLRDSSPPFTHIGGALTSVVRLSNQAELCACASDDGFVSFLGGSDNLRRLRVMYGSIETMAVTPDSACLAVAGADEVIGLLEIAGGRGLARFEGHTGTIRCVQFDPEGGLLASAGDDAAVRIWRVAERAEFRVLRGHNTRVQALTFSPDGDWLVTGDAAGLIRIWDIFGEQHGQIESPHGEVSALAFDKDGGTLVSGHREGTVDCWELAWHLDLSEANLRRHADRAKRRDAAQQRHRDRADR